MSIYSIFFYNKIESCLCLCFMCLLLLFFVMFGLVRLSCYGLNFILWVLVCVCSVKLYTMYPSHNAVSSYTVCAFMLFVSKSSFFLLFI